MKKLLFLIFFISAGFVSLAQFMTIDKLVSDTSFIFATGIYYSYEEFMANDPAVKFNVSMENKNPQYIVKGAELNEYQVTYMDELGQTVNMHIDSIWGYNDGLEIFLSIKGKPYKLYSFGAISILIYEHYNTKHPVAQYATLGLIGITTTSYCEIDWILIDFKNFEVYPYSYKSMKKILKLNDIELYTEFKSDNMYKGKKILKYIERYNERYPVKVIENKLVIQ